jgi:hypothetical protein
MARLRDGSAPEVQRAALALLASAIVASGDFLARRTVDEVWPRLQPLLRDAVRSGTKGPREIARDSCLRDLAGRDRPLHAAAGYRFTAAHRAHCAALACARVMVSHLPLPGRVLRELAAATVALLDPTTAVVGCPRGPGQRAGTGCSRPRGYVYSMLMCGLRRAPCWRRWPRPSLMWRGWHCTPPGHLQRGRRQRLRSIAPSRHRTRGRRWCAMYLYVRSCTVSAGSRQQITTAA